MGFIKAAFGKVNITPEETVSLAGYNPDVNIAQPDKDILDDLYARIAILDDGICRTVIVSLDACFTNEENVKVPLGGAASDREFIAILHAGTRLSWARAAGTTEEHITVNATHTHSAPTHFSSKYTVRIEDKIRELLNQLVEVEISICIGKSELSAFRRPFLKPDYEAAIDQTLHVLMFENRNNELVGSIVAYAVHPTGLLDPADSAAPHRRVSAENVGLAMSELEEMYGNGFISLFLQGFSGDVCPIYGHNGEQEDTYPLIKAGGHQFYLDIAETMKSRKLVSSTPFRSMSHRFQLPTKDGFYRSSMDITLMGIRIGSVVILSVSAEVFNGYVNKIREPFPDNTILLSGLANGYSGYIPTKEAFQDGLGGYEMGTTPYTEEADTILVKQSVQFLKQLLYLNN